MKRGRPELVGLNLRAAPLVYSRELRDRVKRRYLIHRVLRYLTVEGILAALAREFNLTSEKVNYILHQEGVR